MNPSILAQWNFTLKNHRASRQVKEMISCLDSLGVKRSAYVIVRFRGKCYASMIESHYKEVVIEKKKPGTVMLRGTSEYRDYLNLKYPIR